MEVWCIGAHEREHIDLTKRFIPLRPILISLLERDFTFIKAVQVVFLRKIDFLFRFHINERCWFKMQAIYFEWYAWGDKCTKGLILYDPLMRWSTIKGCINLSKNGLIAMHLLIMWKTLDWLLTCIDLLECGSIECCIWVTPWVIGIIISI